jgi:hypothetical protein
MTVCWDFLWFSVLRGVCALEISAMAYRRKFPEQGAYARPLVERAVRLLAMGLIVLGAGAISIGIWADTASVVIGGTVAVMGGSLWRLWLYGKEFRDPPSPYRGR